MHVSILFSNVITLLDIPSMLSLPWSVVALLLVGVAVVVDFFEESFREEVDWEFLDCFEEEDLLLLFPISKPGKIKVKLNITTMCSKNSGNYNKWSYQSYWSEASDKSDWNY